MISNHTPSGRSQPLASEFGSGSTDEQNAALLAEQKSKSTFKTKMRFAEMFQSVSYATQLI
jgi:hypothetical protein